jgi:hypothetical protein
VPGETARYIDEYQRGDPEQLMRDIVNALGRVRERGHEEGNKAGRQHERTEAAEKAAVAEGRETEACLREQLAEALRRGQAQKKRADELAACAQRSPSVPPREKSYPWVLTTQTNATPGYRLLRHVG